MAVKEEIEVFNDTMDMYIKLFCEEQNIDDMKKELQNVWNACMIYIYRKVFRNTGILKYTPNINNEYNIDAVNKVLDDYIYYCGLYGKEVSIAGFEKLTGISRTRIAEWYNNPSCKGSFVYEKLMSENEQSNSDLLSSGKNPVGIAMRLNHWHNWNAPHIHNVGKREQVQIDDARKQFEQFRLEQSDQQTAGD